MEATPSAVISNDLLCSPRPEQAAGILLLLPVLQQRYSFRFSAERHNARINWRALAAATAKFSMRDALSERLPEPEDTNMKGMLSARPVE
jgi:hypothetical protein